MSRAPAESGPFDALAARARASGLPHAIHAHRPTRTMDDAAALLDFEVERIVKTVAFGLRDGSVVLAALRGTRRVDYAALAALAGVRRKDLSALSAPEVAERLGVEPGSVSPLLAPERAVLFLDEDALAIAPAILCGIGRPDRTLEMAPAHVLALAQGRAGRFSK